MNCLKVFFCGLVSVWRQWEGVQAPFHLLSISAELASEVFLASDDMKL